MEGMAAESCSGANDRRTGKQIGNHRLVRDIRGGLILRGKMRKRIGKRMRRTERGNKNGGD